MLAYERRAWLLFRDWCQAAGESALPASPATLSRFLVEVPADGPLAKRRIRAVDAMHAAAGFEPPGRDGAVRALIVPQVPPSPPRHDRGMVAKALTGAVIGNWPAGLVGRRDAALVAMVCAGGYSRRELRSMRVNAGLLASIPSALARVPRAEAPVPGPACALSRWLRVHAFMAAHGWRELRNELADMGEVTAGSREDHDCEQPLAWPRQLDGGPLFMAVDHRGGLELRLALSKRSVTAIVGAHLADSGEGSGQDEQARVVGGLTPAYSVEEAIAMRRASLVRLEELDRLVDHVDAMAEAVLAGIDLDGPGRRP